jgi:glycyl-tRNA synthetase beta chain
MPELLLELLSEEIPARMQRQAADDLKRLVGEGLKAAGLAFADAHAYVTPRRLALAMTGLPVAQPDVKEEKRGPRVDAPQNAIDGFLKSAGLTLDQCEKRDTGKGTFWFAVIEKKGRPTQQVLLDILAPTIWSFPWPKSMRWQNSRATWVRPLHSILLVFDGHAISGRISFEGSVAFEFSNTTRGHRFLAPQPFTATGFADYREKLRNAFVILDQDERRDEIKRQIDALAAGVGLTVREDPGLLDEVTGLVEWPVAHLGHIDGAFMDLPPEVLTTSMRAHQKYFSCLTADGRLANRFVVVANRPTADGGKAVVAGNERVLKARLSDAKFFWDHDRKTRLESRVPKLAERVFHAKLGSLADKVQRVRKLAAEIARRIPGADPKEVERGALLAKADLSTGMVGEFPELQGVMGRYYALHDGEVRAVADAIAEHYSPLGPNDRCPAAPVSVAVALADKIDSLVGFFAIGEKPTGSKDPFALRRAALGVIRLVVENGLRLPLADLLDRADAHYAEQKKTPSGAFKLDELLDFFADRLKVALREKGVRHDLIAAVFALGGEDDLVRLLARVEALGRFLGTDDGANLLVAYRRAANIVRIEEKKDGARYDGGVEAGLLGQDEEKALWDRLAHAGGPIAEALKTEAFDRAMSTLAGLRRPVDTFFDRVTVNCNEPELRANRLRLLAQIKSAMNQVADFSKIEGG